MSNKKKRFDITDMSVREIIIKIVLEGIDISNDKNWRTKPSEYIPEKILEDILRNHKPKNVIIQGLRTTTLRMIISRLKDANNVEEVIEEELRLIEEREKAQVVTIKQINIKQNQFHQKKPFN